MISFMYFGLLLLLIALYWLIPKQIVRNVLLIVGSLFYLYTLDVYAVLVVVALSVFTYIMGRAIYVHSASKYIHVAGVIGILSTLLVFKYLGLLEATINSLMQLLGNPLRFEISKLLLPLGISYIVFKHISYITDVKWGLVKPGSFIEFLLYSSFFTIFVAGPIERWERFKPQVEPSRIEFKWEDIDYGFMRIVFGLFKKLVIADWLGYVCSPILQNLHHYGHGSMMLALMGYSLQIYFDFAGYSDIAIGSSRLFGLRIMENFQNPYFAPNISQFWRRWHISLSDWIRDYLFFPLSSLSSSKIWLMFFVPVIAMSLCGLWHGAAWHYVLWGCWHGIGLAVYQIWGSIKRKHKALAKASKANWCQYAATLTTFVFVTIGWVWFR